MAFVDIFYRCSTDGRWETLGLPCGHSSRERHIAFQLRSYLFAAELEQVEVDFDDSDYIIRLRREERTGTGRVPKTQNETPAAGEEDPLYEAVWQAFDNLTG